MPESSFDQLTSSSRSVPDLPSDLHALDYLAFLMRRTRLVVPCVFIVAALFLPGSSVIPSTSSSTEQKKKAQILSERVVCMCIAAIDSLLTSHLQGEVHQHVLYAEADYHRHRQELDSLEDCQQLFEQEHGIVQLKAQTTASIVQLASLKAEELQAEIE